MCNHNSELKPVIHNSCANQTNSILNSTVIYNSCGNQTSVHFWNYNVNEMNTCIHFKMLQMKWKHGFQTTWYLWKFEGIIWILIFSESLRERRSHDGHAPSAQYEQPLVQAVPTVTVGVATSGDWHVTISTTCHRRHTCTPTARRWPSAIPPSAHSLARRNIATLPGRRRTGNSPVVNSQFTTSGLDEI
jgi:hypothetical protein